MMKRARSAVALTVLVLASGAGCTVPPNFDQAVDQEFARFAKTLEARVAFDPFANQVHLGETRSATAAGWYGRFIDEIQARMPDGTVLPDRSARGAGGIAETTPPPEELRSRLAQAGVGEKWLAAATEALKTRGFVLTQAGFAKEGATHGVYEVPCRIVAFARWSRGPTTVYRMPVRELTVKGEPPRSPGAAAPEPLSARERLLELQRLREEGLLTEEEYQAKRRKIIDGM